MKKNKQLINNDYLYLIGKRARFQINTTYLGWPGWTKFFK